MLQMIAIVSRPSFKELQYYTTLALCRAAYVKCLIQNAALSLLPGESQNYYQSHPDYTYQGTNPYFAEEECVYDLHIYSPGTNIIGHTCE